MFSGSQISIHKDALTVTNKRKLLQTEFKLHGHTLSRVTSAKYLGVTITNDLKWDIYINNICKKSQQNTQLPTKKPEYWIDSHQAAGILHHC